MESKDLLDAGIEEVHRFKISGIEVLLAVSSEFTTLLSNLITNALLVFGVMSQLVHEPSESTSSGFMAGKEKSASYDMSSLSNQNER